MMMINKFKQYDYLIDIIRQLINPQFLKTKKECLRFYARNYFNATPYTKEMEDIIDVGYHVGINYNHYRSYSHKEYYDIEKCLFIVKDNDNKFIEKKLNVTDIYNLLDTLQTKFIKKILKAITFPTNKWVQLLISMENNKTNLFPINKTCLLEMSSFKFINKFHQYFYETPLSKQISCKTMIIKNKDNDCIIKIPKDVFNQYCHITSLIKNTDEKIKEITLPFTFNNVAGDYFLQCLIHEYIQPMNNFNEQDFNEFKKLMSYLQVSFVC